MCVATSEGWFLEVFFNALAMVEVSAIYPVHILRMILIINNSLQIHTHKMILPVTDGPLKLDLLILSFGNTYNSMVSEIGRETSYTQREKYNSRYRTA